VAITSKLNAEGKLLHVLLSEVAHLSVHRHARSRDHGVLRISSSGGEEAARQIQEDRIVEALHNVQRDDDDMVEYSEFLSLLAKYAQVCKI